MTDDDFDKRIAAQIRSNQEKLELLEGKFEHLTRQCFASPERANKLMEAMSQDQGESAVFHALRLEPHVFGDLPEGRAAASLAEEKRPELAVVFEDYRRLRDATDELLMTQERRAKAKQSGASPEATPQPTAESAAGANVRKVHKQQMEQWKKNAPQRSGGKSNEVGAEWEPDQ